MKRRTPLTIPAGPEQGVGMSALLGVTDRGVLLWRRGEYRPSGANILAITELACSIPGGVETLCQGDAGALTLWVRDGDTGGDGGE